MRSLSVCSRRLLHPLTAMVVLATLVVLPGCSDSGSRIPPPPPSRIGLVVDTLHGVEVPDPYRWLEDTQSEETRAWVEAQNAYAEQIVGNPPVRAWLESRLRELTDRDDVGNPRRAGEYEYFTLRRKGEEVEAIYRRPAPPEGDTTEIDPAGEYEKVLDPLLWSPDGTTSLGILSFSPDGKLLLYSVRDGGPDEYAMRVRDLEGGEDLPETFPPALYAGVAFTGEGSGFYYTRRSRDPGEGTRILLHRIGTDPATDAVLFGEGYGPSTYLDVSEAEDGRYRVYAVRHGWATSELYIQDRDGPVRPVVNDADARFYHRVHEGHLYIRTNLDANNNRLLAVPLDAPERGNWREVIPEAEDVMDDFTFIGNRIYVTYLHDASDRIRVFEMDGTPAGEVEVPPMHSASIRGGGPGSALLTLSSFTSPSTTWRLNLETGERTIEEPPEVEWDGSRFQVSQVWRTSRDGTRAPMFLVHRPDIELNGQNPTLLTGYGGFYVARTPGFNSTAALWLDMGGVYALATLRGGSEYGESWHRDGMLLNKQHVFDDFLSAAEWLIENGYTDPEHLAIQGGSNGGLLVGAATTQRPDLFRAVVCSNPDLDILRFPWHYEANSPPALLEYGDATLPEHFGAIRQYSPLQNVREETAYPAVFFSTGALDTRVPPQGARKMAAHMQAVSTSGYPVILDYSHRAGHAGGRPMSDRIRLNAMQLTFLVEQLGMEVLPASPPNG